MLQERGRGGAADDDAPLHRTWASDQFWEFLLYRFLQFATQDTRVHDSLQFLRIVAQIFVENKFIYHQAQIINRAIQTKK